MAGILDSKERVMDFIITQEGKRQAGAGELRVRFASFTDHQTFYEKSGSLALPNLSSNASDRIFFEAFSRYQDVIVPELEAGQSMRPFRTADFNVGGQLITSGTFKIGFADRANIVSGSDLQDSASQVLEGITQNFLQQGIISSIDEYSAIQDFGVQPENFNFSVNAATKYARSSGDGEVKLENVPSLFHDRRFSRFPNFSYLPPENLPLPGEKHGEKLGLYPRLNEENIETLDELMSTLEGKQKVDISFNPTSRTNNIVCQVFESCQLGSNAPTMIDKLSVVDFGVFDDKDNSAKESLLSPGRRVFFVGKMRRDVTGAETFMCIFTVLLD